MALDVNGVDENKLKMTLATLSNCAELVQFVSLEVLGNDVADTFNGSPIGREMVYDLVNSSILKNLNNYRKI